MKSVESVCAKRSVRPITKYKAQHSEKEKNISTQICRERGSKRYLETDGLDACEHQQQHGGGEREGAEEQGQEVLAARLALGQLPRGRIFGLANCEWAEHTWIQTRDIAMVVDENMLLFVVCVCLSLPYIARVPDRALMS